MYDGCISILHQTAKTDVSKLRKTLSRYGKVVGEIELVPELVHSPYGLDSLFRQYLARAA